MKKGFLTISTLSILFFCVLLQLFIAHKLSPAGIEVSTIENEIRTLSSENEDLRPKTASFSSLTAIASRAGELGFKEASFYYVEKPPIARVQ